MRKIKNQCFTEGNVSSTDKYQKLKTKKNNLDPSKDQPLNWSKVIQGMRDMSFLSRADRLEAFNVNNISSSTVPAHEPEVAPITSFSARLPKIFAHSGKKMNPSHASIHREIINQHREAKGKPSPRITNRLYREKSCEMKRVFRQFNDHYSLYKNDN